jgi:glycosyltransferase involved in cell wall biosynthesis
MRIIFINSARGWGGGLTSTADLGLGLAELGHEITMVCHPDSAIRERLRDDARVTLVPVAIRAEINPYRVWQLARLNRRVRPDVVMADKRKDVKLSVTARAFSDGFPVVHRHGAPSALRDSLIYRFYWGEHVGALIVNSYTMRERMLEKAPWLRKVDMRVIHNGKDLSRYRPIPEARERIRKALGIPPDSFLVSFHGMVQPRKRVDVLVRAVAELARELDVRALIIGGGPTLAEIERLAAETGAPTIFTGIRTNIPELLAAADVSVHLSIAEGFSNSVIEAMACGLPMIVSDATSHSEQVDHGVQGLLVPAGDPRAVVSAIRELASDPAERRRMGSAARERAVAEFSLQTMIERYDKVLRETVDRYGDR